MLFSFALLPCPPFRLDLTVWTLRRRPENAIDVWDEGVYRRVMVIQDCPVLIEVRQRTAGRAAGLVVEVHCKSDWPQLRRAVTAALERLLGIRLELTDFYRFANDQPMLDLLAQRFVGMKPPRYLSVFECLVNAIACQQVSLASGIQLLNRFAQTFGCCYQTSRFEQHAFPRPGDLLDVGVDDLRHLGFSRQKATAVLTLAAQVRAEEIDLTSLGRLADQAVLERLCALRGIGRWSAEYALLRGLGRLHVFPGDDVGASNSLQQWLNLSEKLDYQSVSDALSSWRRYGGLIYLHLLLSKLAEKGYMAPSN